MHELIHPRDIQVWQELLDEGKLSLQVDPETGVAQFYPRPANLATAGHQLEWREASGAAELIACTVVRVGGPMIRKAPYLFGMVRLAEGPRILAIIEGDPEQVPVPGTRLRAVIDSARTPNLVFQVTTS